MAQEYLKDNATSLAAANWELADGTAGSGFSGAATLRVSRGAQAVTQATDQSGATTGVESFDVMPDFVGMMGDESHHLKFDCDGTAESAANHVSRFRYWANAGECWYNSANGCHFLDIRCGGSFFATGGTFKHVHMERGFATVNDATSCTAGGTWYILGGTLTLEEHASNTFNIITVRGGGSASKPNSFGRGGTTLNIKNGRNLLDIKNGTVTNLNVDDGYLAFNSHNATGPTLTAIGGIIDFTKLSRPVTFTNAVLGPVQFIGFNRNLITLTSPSYVGGGPIGLN